MSNTILKLFVLTFWFANISFAELIKADATKGDVFDITNYTAVHYDENKVQGIENMYNFFASLEAYISGKKQKVNIIHIGDSHIQADFLSHAARKLFQKTFGNGGRGFVYPYRLARSNSPVNLKIKHRGTWQSCRSIRLKDDCNFGVSGASATTFDTSSWLKIDPHRDLDMNYEFNRIKLFSNNNTNTFLPVFLDGDSSKVDYDIQQISESVSEVFFVDHQDSMWLAFEKKYIQNYFQLFGLSFENNNPGVVYHAIGLNGAYAKSYLRNQFFEEQLASLSGDLIILSLGTNDGYMNSSRFCSNCFKSDYTKLVKKIKEASPNASILLMTPGDYFIRRRYHNSNIQKIVSAILEIAEENETAVLDFNKVMGGDYSMQSWKNSGLGRGDMIHFTRDGYQLQGQLLYNAIMDAYETQFND